MSTVTVSVNGILKLLKDLNPHKATEPDQIKTLVLQRLRDVVTPILQVILQKSLADYQKTGILHKYVLCLRKETQAKHPITDLYL